MDMRKLWVCVCVCERERGIGVGGKEVGGLL